MYQISLTTIFCFLIDILSKEGAQIDSVECFFKLDEKQNCVDIFKDFFKKVFFLIEIPPMI